VCGDVEERITSVPPPDKRPTMLSKVLLLSALAAVEAYNSGAALVRPASRVTAAARSCAAPVMTEETDMLKVAAAKRAKYEAEVAAENARKEQVRLEAATKLEETRANYIAALEQEGRDATPPAMAFAAPVVEEEEEATVAAEAAVAEKQTPARLFEKIMAPAYIPPAVKKARPELVEKYQSKKKAAGVAKPVAAPRPAAAPKAAATPKATISTPKAANPFGGFTLPSRKAAAPKRAQPKRAAPERAKAAAKPAATKKPASNLFGGLVLPTQSVPTRGARKPAKVVKAATKAPMFGRGAQKTTKTAKAAVDDKAETPAQLFEKIMAPVYIPPSVRESRPELVEKYGKKK
jgi:hypothetical protein